MNSGLSIVLQKQKKVGSLHLKIRNSKSVRSMEIVNSLGIYIEAQFSTGALRINNIHLRGLSP